MNYSNWIFWFLFALLMAPYWKLTHRRQNQVLLVSSYLFYGFWDYRFLFLILIATVIDFIGGLGVAGVRLTAERLSKLGLLIIGSAFVLCSNIRYDLLRGGLAEGKFAAAALPHTLRDFAIPLGITAVVILYGLALPSLYALSEEKRRKVFLVISMVSNLAILGFFKYFDFFISSFAQVLESIGLGHYASTPLGLILPAGISFYTFQAMSYTIDIYRRQVEPTKNFGDFALFVCFFPHLVAGPIMRAHTLLPQVVQPRQLKRGAFEEGLLLVLIGLFKKIVIADNMAPLANAIFARYAGGHEGVLPTGPETWLGIYAFAFQIYGDFSGYSSVARGISKWLGFELVVNFRMPYLAVSPADFWRRWHISLSTWLRDYLYIPLGGNRRGIALMYRNLMLTMLIGGLWHGASWTFVAWGFFHGALLCLFRVFNIKDIVPGNTIFTRLNWAFRVVVMFHLTCLGWLLFRADSFSTVVAMFNRMAADYNMTSEVVSSLALLVFYCGLLFLLEWMWDGEQRLDKATSAPWYAKSLLYTYLCGMLLIFHAEKAYEFIYFQF